MAVKIGDDIQCKRARYWRTTKSEFIVSIEEKHKYPLKNQTAIQIDNKNQIEKQLLDFIKSGYEWFSENEDFTLENYQCHPTIKAPVAV